MNSVSRFLRMSLITLLLFMGAHNLCHANTILNFTALDLTTSNLTLSHTAGGVTTLNSSSPVRLDITSAVNPAMMGTAYISFVSVMSSGTPSSSGSLSHFNGSIIISKSATDYSGSNLVLRLDFINAILDLNGSTSGAFRMYSGGPHSLALSSYYTAAIGNENAAITFAFDTPTGFTSPDTSSFITGLNPSTGTVSADLVAVPEPSTFLVACFAGIALVRVRGRAPKFGTDMA